MRWVRFSVLILVVTIVQASLSARLGVGSLHIRPDLLLVFLVFFAIYSKVNDAIITSFVIGFACDIASPGTAVGSHTLSFCVIGTILTRLNRIIAIRKMPYQAIAIFVVGFLTGVLAHFLSMPKYETMPTNVYTVIFGQSLYSSVIGPFLFLPAAWLMGIKIGCSKRI